MRVLISQPGSRPNCVIVGPSLIAITLASTPKEASVSTIRRACWALRGRRTGAGVRAQDGQGRELPAVVAAPGVGAAVVRQFLLGGACARPGRSRRCVLEGRWASRAGLLGGEVRRMFVQRGIICRPWEGEGGLRPGIGGERPVQAGGGQAYGQPPAGVQEAQGAPGRQQQRSGEEEEQDEKGAGRRSEPVAEFTADRGLPQIDPLPGSRRAGGARRARGGPRSGGGLRSGVGGCGGLGASARR